MLYSWQAEVLCDVFVGSTVTKLNIVFQGVSVADIPILLVVWEILGELCRESRLSEDL